MKVDALESTVQKTHTWLNEIAAYLGHLSGGAAYHALRAVLHALRDRMSVDDAAAIGAQLPLLVRGVFFEGWRPHGKPLHLRKPDEFLALVDRYLAHDREFGLDSRRVLDAVLTTLKAHVDKGAFEQIMRSFPEEAQSLFTTARSSHPAGH